MKKLLEKARKNILEKEDILYILNLDEKNLNDLKILEELQEIAEEFTLKNFGKKIYIRGLIEYSNYCSEDCYYCGIRKSNLNITRYRLSIDEVMTCAKYAYDLGFRTFVLQGGEDKALKDEYFLEIIKKIKSLYKDTRITLSLGRKSYESLEKFKLAGADRFLLRHETVNEELFSKIHPKNQTFEERKNMLYDLKKLEYTTGSGFMAGFPYQKNEDIVDDIEFLKKLQPEMIGIGPFIPQSDTPFKDEKQGSLELTLKILIILRILFQNALLPSTTALNTIDKRGRVLGIKCGANVIMPNISPKYAKENYKLYNNKNSNNLEAATHLGELKKQLQQIDRYIVEDVGDYKKI